VLVDQLRGCVEHALDALATTSLDGDSAQDGGILDADLIGIQPPCSHRCGHTVPSSDRRLATLETRVKLGLLCHALHRGESRTTRG
jgi:hypothetical protein